MRALSSFAVWFAALEVVWLLLVGTFQSTEVIAGLGAAALAAAFAELLRRRGLLSYRVAPGLLVRAWRLPMLVAFDFVLVTRVLVTAMARRRRVSGSWVRVPFEVEDGPRGRWQRAFAVATSNGAANAIVVDLDDGDAVMHALRPDAFTASSVL